MTDIQLLTLALAVIVPLSLLIYSNSRISDVRASIAEAERRSHESITEAKDTLRAEMGTLRAEMQAQSAELRLLIERNHSELMLKLADMDGRLTRIENERRIVQ
jgi:ATP/maltotriose-dependent transcriptional regulator MalT